jgi:two-component system, chemotaxis family, chemotaxis protein CheY
MSATVLLIDDDEGIREALPDLLTYAGWTVVLAGDGCEALEWLMANDSPAVILLDLKMPRCDGYEFRARQMADARLRAVPTVVFSADASFEACPGSPLAGLPIVRKSSELEKLLAALAAAAGRAPRRR